MLTAANIHMTARAAHSDTTGNRARILLSSIMQHDRAGFEQREIRDQHRLRICPNGRKARRCASCFISRRRTRESDIVRLAYLFERPSGTRMSRAQPHRGQATVQNCDDGDRRRAPVVAGRCPASVIAAILSWLGFLLFVSTTNDLQALDKLSSFCG